MGRLKKENLFLILAIVVKALFDTSAAGTISSDDVQVEDLDNVGVRIQGCVFPFIYKGEAYNYCTKSKSKYLWCSVDAEYNGRYRYCEKKAVTIDNKKDKYAEVLERIENNDQRLKKLAGTTGCRCAIKSVTEIFLKFEKIIEDHERRVTEVDTRISKLKIIIQVVEKIRKYEKKIRIIIKENGKGKGGGKEGEDGIITERDHIRDCTRKRTCYLFFKIKVTETDAHFYCRKHGGILTPVPNRHINSWLTGRSAIYGGGTWFIGVNDKRKEGQFLDSNGHRAKYLHFSPGEPDDLKQSIQFPQYDLTLKKNGKRFFRVKKYKIRGGFHKVVTTRHIRKVHIRHKIKIKVSGRFTSRKIKIGGKWIHGRVKIRTKWGRKIKITTKWTRRKIKVGGRWIHGKVKVGGKFGTRIKIKCKCRNKVKVGGRWGRKIKIGGRWGRKIKIGGGRGRKIKIKITGKVIRRKIKIGGKWIHGRVKIRTKWGRKIKITTKWTRRKIKVRGRWIFGKVKVGGKFGTRIKIKCKGKHKIKIGGKWGRKIKIGGRWGRKIKIKITGKVIRRKIKIGGKWIHGRVKIRTKWGRKIKITTKWTRRKIKIGGKWIRGKIKIGDKFGKRIKIRGKFGKKIKIGGKFGWKIKIGGRWGRKIKIGGGIFGKHKIKITGRRVIIGGGKWGRKIGRGKIHIRIGIRHKVIIRTRYTRRRWWIKKKWVIRRKRRVVWKRRWLKIWKKRVGFHKRIWKIRFGRIRLVLRKVIRFIKWGLKVIIDRVGKRYIIEKGIVIFIRTIIKTRTGLVIVIDKNGKSWVRKGTRWVILRPGGGKDYDKGIITDYKNRRIIIIRGGRKVIVTSVKVIGKFVIVISKGGSRFTRKGGIWIRVTGSKFPWIKFVDKIDWKFPTVIKGVNIKRIIIAIRVIVDRILKYKTREIIEKNTGNQKIIVIIREKIEKWITEYYKKISILKRVGLSKTIWEYLKKIKLVDYKEKDDEDCVVMKSHSSFWSDSSCSAKEKFICLKAK